MRREVIQVTGRGDYIISSGVYIFSNAGGMEGCLHIYHQMVLAVLQGEGALRNHRYVGISTRWPFTPPKVRLHTEGRGWVVHNSQGKGRQELEIKSGESSLNLKGNIAIVRS